MVLKYLFPEKNAEFYEDLIMADALHEASELALRYIQSNPSIEPKDVVSVYRAIVGEYIEGYRIKPKTKPT